MESLKLFPSHSTCYCPICNKKFPRSEYLKENIEDKKTEWIANIITHHRHEHITSWNKCWDYGGNSYRANWFSDYDTEKRKINERAKRQLIRKATHFLIDNEIEFEHFKKLQFNSIETLHLLRKQLPVIENV
ncbi:hypothetical protein [Pedobacter sp.]|uniref:hypothetical protein n=1 Tax=Pedobacter sp. TaxID=1411316 RepID=UPI003BABE7C6